MTDLIVDRIVRRIAEAVHPEQIFLFGSRAMGTARPDSDVDLVVVYSGHKSKRDLKLEIHSLFEHPDFSMDVFVLSPDEIERQRHVANTLAREVSEKGVLVYG